LFLSLIALTALLTWRGLAFYRLDLEARLDHEDFRTLSPGAIIGHGYGVFGTFLVLTNLLYLARRRFARWNLGSMRAWLNLHVFTGLFGSVLILFHSAFQVRSQIASVTSISLGLVVVSGVVGRYFYSLAPRNQHHALREQLTVLEVFDATVPQKLQALIAGFAEPPTPSRATLFDSLATIPAWIAHERRRTAAIRELLQPLLADGSLSRDERRYLRAAAREVESIVKEPMRTAAGVSLIRTWRGLHRFMALLMIVSVSVHIAVAWVFGYRWIFE
jgi:hypothetical protein